MKKLFFFLIALMLAGACQKEKIPMIWDMSFSYIDIAVVDANGNNLIDPDFEGNILNDEITMEHDGTIYELFHIQGAHDQSSNPYSRYRVFQSGVRRRAHRVHHPLGRGEKQPDRI